MYFRLTAPDISSTGDAAVGEMSDPSAFLFSFFCPRGRSCQETSTCFINVLFQQDSTHPHAYPQSGMFGIQYHCAEDICTAYLIRRVGGLPVNI